MEIQPHFPVSIRKGRSGLGQIHRQVGMIFRLEVGEILPADVEIHPRTGSRIRQHLSVRLHRIGPQNMCPGGQPVQHHRLQCAGVLNGRSVVHDHVQPVSPVADRIIFRSHEYVHGFPRHYFPFFR